MASPLSLPLATNKSQLKSKHLGKEFVLAFVFKFIRSLVIRTLASGGFFSQKKAFCPPISPKKGDNTTDPDMVLFISNGLFM